LGTFELAVSIRTPSSGEDAVNDLPQKAGLALIDVEGSRWIQLPDSTTLAGRRELTISVAEADRLNAISAYRPRDSGSRFQWGGAPNCLAKNSVEAHTFPDARLSAGYTAQMPGVAIVLYFGSRGASAVVIEPEQRVVFRISK
jgi:hypothetical protein